jgi:hypothetical protein
MKVSFGRRTRAVLFVVAGALVIVVLSFRSRGPASEAGPAKASPLADRSSLPALPQVPAPAVPTVESPEEEVVELPRGTPLNDDYDDNPMAEVLRPILASDRHLKVFRHYYNRPLLGEADREKYRKLLSDVSTFAEVKHDLLYPEETTVDQAGNIKRLMKIDYLRAALEWKDNPMREQLLATIEEVILTDNYPPGMGMDMRLSLSGNKKELYELLVEFAPDRASAVLAASRGTRLEGMVAFFDKSLQERQANEAASGAEVKP